MLTTERSPMCDDDITPVFGILDPIHNLAASLAELEAKAWLLDLRMTAMLIGAALMELREA